MNIVKFPLDPVVRVAGVESDLALAALIAKDHKQVQRWRESGMTERLADEIATSLGRHPVELWPNWYSAEPIQGYRSSKRT